MVVESEARPVPFVPAVPRAAGRVSRGGQPGPPSPSGRGRGAAGNPGMDVKRPSRAAASLALAFAMLAAPACTPGPGGAAPQMEISRPWSRAVPPGAPVAAGYFAIRNRSGVDDRLVEVRSAAARRVEIHQVRHEGGTMRMRQLADGLPLPEGRMVVLEPGRYHLMFIAPMDVFEAGRRVPVTLVFEHAPPVEVALVVRSMADTGHSGH